MIRLLKNQMFRRRIIMLFLSLTMFTTACISFGVGLTHGWFSNFWTSNDKKVVLTTKDVLAPDVYLWTYTTEEEDSNNVGWEKTALSTNANNKYDKDLPSIITNNNDGSTIVLKNMHFGKIDNLVTMKDDNICYLEFKLDKEKNGSLFKLNVSDIKDGNHLTIYKPDDLTNQNTTYSLFEQTEESLGMTNAEFNALAKSLLVGYYYCSETELDVSTIQEQEKNNNITFTKFSEDGSMQYEEENADTYYVYVKFTPNLSSFATIAKILYKIMPCYAFYNIEIQYEVYTPRKENS